ncbi:putative ATP-dependent RNA helicase [Dioszegia hungarica]|uniref:RNA helicase n=1 Tax=Dioszegia hungarica TaxID=4972 RepID=A0AA38HG73_9TREE|nr:putative ATP-dependent RNA helicase [Dioszegia hungarica]KAI9638214.1 putative ATP-dependent RNA helicase [Dioszegia hungarica]
MSHPSDSLLDADLTFSQPPFSSLDPRILKALADQKFAHPTLVQAKAIPLLLEGKDVLARARTGSGKTAAYCVPAVQKVLATKEYQATRVVIVVPTRELSMQVATFLGELTVYCEEAIKVVNVAAGAANLQRILLNENPDIIISTPSRLLSLLLSKSIDLSLLAFLAIDEADLLLSYGHKDDMETILATHVPRLGVQGCLVSATLSEDVEGIKAWLKQPAILTLSEHTASLLTQFVTHTTERDKFLLIYVLLKLKLIRGKSIVFVNDIDRGYRLKLFLGQFGIKTCVVNSELPLASRYHVVEEFNRGVYDVVVATDEANEEEVQPRKRQKVDPASMARGIDFTNAASVINFDLPSTPTSYMHRVGRTARAGQSGLALSFVVPKEQWGKDRPVSVASAERDEVVLPKIRDVAGEIKDWDWGGRKKEIEGFRYRMEDALRAVTAKRVQDARREEVRRELLNSEKLKAHFASNPLDLDYLRHDTISHPVRQQSHLKHVPGYLMPKIAAAPLGTGDVAEGSGVSFHKRGGSRGRGGRGGRGRGGKKVDPLRMKG